MSIAGQVMFFGILVAMAVVVFVPGRGAARSIG